MSKGQLWTEIASCAPRQPFVDFSLFLDAGKVFDDLDDFNFDNMHTGYGAGLRIHTPGGVAFRMDVAHSTEGFKLHISGGPTF